MHDMRIFSLDESIAMMRGTNSGDKRYLYMYTRLVLLLAKQNSSNRLARVRDCFEEIARVRICEGAAVR